LNYFFKLSSKVLYVEWNSLFLNNWNLYTISCKNFWQKYYLMFQTPARKTFQILLEQWGRTVKTFDVTSCTNTELIYLFQCHVWGGKLDHGSYRVKSTSCESWWWPFSVLLSNQVHICMYRKMNFKKRNLFDITTSNIYLRHNVAILVVYRNR
jgi:hypothetical protein